MVVSADFDVERGVADAEDDDAASSDGGGALESSVPAPSSCSRLATAPVPRSASARDDDDDERDELRVGGMSSTGIRRPRDDELREAGFESNRRLASSIALAMPLDAPRSTVRATGAGGESRSRSACTSMRSKSPSNSARTCK